MTNMNRTHQSGLVNVWLVLTIVFAVTTVAGAGAFVWAYGNFSDQKNNVDTKISTAVATAEKEQADKDEAKFLEREKEPFQQFVGPEDYGRVMFDYPKTWSVYISRDTTSGGSFEAFLNPVSIPPLSSSTQVALRVTIESRSYDSAVQAYSGAVRQGALVSSAVQADDVTGTRLDGTFTNDIRGSAVLFKIRDKTVTIRTDAVTFKPDFDRLISTITFNK
jgi:hypothetical protein